MELTRMKAQLDESEDLFLRSKSSGKSTLIKEDKNSLRPLNENNSMKGSKSMTFEDQGGKSIKRDSSNRPNGVYGSEASDKYSVRSFPSPSKSKNTPRLIVPESNPPKSRSISNNATNNSSSKNNNNANLNVRSTITIEKNSSSSKTSKDYENQNNYDNFSLRPSVDNSNARANKKQL